MNVKTTEQKPKDLANVEDQDLDKDPLKDEDLDETDLDDADADKSDDDESDKTDDDDDSEDDADADKTDKANPKAEKRINSLTAKIKTLEEQNTEQREKISFYEDKLSKSEEKLLKKTELPPYNGRPLAVISPEDFQDAVDKLMALDNITADQKTAIVQEAIQQRKSEEAVQHRKLEAEKLQAVNTRWAKEWMDVSLAIKDKDHGFPGIEKYEQEIKDQLQADMAESEFLTTKLLKGSVSVKFEYAMKVAEKLGVFKKLKLKAYSKDRPGLQAPVGKPGRSTPASSGGKSTFTREQVEKMSMKEYLKNEKAIDEAIKAGRYK